MFHFGKKNLKEKCITTKDQKKDQHKNILTLEGPQLVNHIKLLGMVMD